MNNSQMLQAATMKKTFLLDSKDFALARNLKRKYNAIWSMRMRQKGFFQGIANATGSYSTK